MNYNSFVLIYSVSIVLMLDALKELDVQFSDSQNAYLDAKSK